MIVSSPDGPGHDEPPLEDGGNRESTVRVRLMGANITSGNNQSYQDPGIHIFKGVAPDVVMLQEFNVGSNSAAEIRAFVDNTFGPGFQYYREGAAQIPNGVISRWPIIESGEWDDPAVTNRDFAWARIDIPGSVDLYVVSVHLLTANASTRQSEAQSLVGFLSQIPAGSYLAMGGDFNTDNRDEPCLATLRQQFVIAAPFPADQNGNEATNASRAKPYDYVLANSALNSNAVAVQIGGSTYPSGLVVDSRVYTPLSELAPVVVGDSGAVNMQHMAVVRDFAVPVDQTPPPSSVTVLSPNGGETWAAGSARSITWTSTQIDSVKVEVTYDGLSWTTLAASVPAAMASFAWTVPQTATTKARARVSQAGTTTGPKDESDGPFAIAVAPPPVGRVFMNEILANEPGADQAGEFIELVNPGTAPIDLSGYTISDVRTVRHVFAAGTVLTAGHALVVYGHESGIPANVSNAIGSSTGLLSITNSGDTMTLKDKAAATVDTVTFTQALAMTDGLSMNRDPDGDPAGTFVLHNVLSPDPASPGKHTDGTPFGDPVGEPGGITSEVEPNDSAGTASGPLALGTAVNGAIATSTDADWFKLTLPAASRVTISLAITGSADLDWYLYRADAPTTYLARGYSTANPEAKSYDAAAGAYLVKVVGYQGAKASYALTVTSP